MSDLLRAAAAIALLTQGIAGASLEGRVEDSHHQPVASIAVQLKTESQLFTAKTSADGHYIFPSLAAATYTLRAEISGQGDASFGPFTLAENEQKNVDLTLHAAKPEFFDQPTFIVAGVADTTSQGGHGSDVILRSSEALTKAAAALGKDSSANRAPLARQAEMDERNAKPLEAVRKYQRAAELDPTEPNFFDWAAELLAHRAYDPAIEVLERGHREFPQSTRMLVGLAVAHYARGSYDQAAERFFEAADLNPSDPGPYLFLAKTQNSVIAESGGYFERMARFAKLQPDNAWANYYYAASLWKQKGAAAEVMALLDKALRLDPSLAAARLELGIVHADQKQFPQAIAEFQKAIELDPRLEEAHYRLAKAYARTGENLKAQKEFELHGQLGRESAAQIERERRQVQQFVIELRRPQ
jgi:tetratricopeptide (TPR) repeat protein